MVGPSGFLLLINIDGRFYCTHEGQLAEVSWVLPDPLNFCVGGGMMGLKSVNKATSNSQTTLSILRVAYFPFVRKT